MEITKCDSGFRLCCVVQAAARPMVHEKKLTQSQNVSSDSWGK